MELLMRDNLLNILTVPGTYKYVFIVFSHIFPGFFRNEWAVSLKKITYSVKLKFS